MIYLQVEDSISAQGFSPVDANLLKGAAEQTLRHITADLPADATLVLADDAELHRLNQQYLDVDAPTDVLAFPGGDTDPDTQVMYLGDVIISYPRALAQAQAGGHPVEAELQLLIVHGMLHLLDYDHRDATEKDHMWQAQAAILTSLGCPITGPATG
jgi:probable rRNA maturation factor